MYYTIILWRRGDYIHYSTDVEVVVVGRASTTAAASIAVRGRGCTSVVFHLVWQQQLLAARGRRGHVGAASSAIAASPNFETLLLLLLTELLLPPRLFFLRRERERENFSVGRRWDEPDQPYEINDIQNWEYIYTIAPVRPATTTTTAMRTEEGYQKFCCCWFSRVMAVDPTTWEAIYLL